MHRLKTKQTVTWSDLNDPYTDTLMMMNNDDNELSVVLSSL